MSGTYNSVQLESTASSWVDTLNQRNAARSYLVFLLKGQEFNLAIFMAKQMVHHGIIFKEDFRYVLETAKLALSNGFVEIKKN